MEEKPFSCEGGGHGKRLPQLQSSIEPQDAAEGVASVRQIIKEVLHDHWFEHVGGQITQQQGVYAEAGDRPELLQRVAVVQDVVGEASKLHTLPCAELLQLVRAQSQIVNDEALRGRLPAMHRPDQILQCQKPFLRTSRYKQH